MLQMREKVSWWRWLAYYAAFLILPFVFALVMTLWIIKFLLAVCGMVGGYYGNPKEKRTLKDEFLSAWDADWN